MYVRYACGVRGMRAVCEGCVRCVRGVRAACVKYACAEHRDVSSAALLCVCVCVCGVCDAHALSTDEYSTGVQCSRCLWCTKVNCSVSPEKKMSANSLKTLRRLRRVVTIASGDVTPVIASVKYTRTPTHMPHTQTQLKHTHDTHMPHTIIHTQQHQLVWCRTHAHNHTCFATQRLCTDSRVAPRLP